MVVLVCLPGCLVTQLKSMLVLSKIYWELGMFLTRVITACVLFLVFYVVIAWGGAFGMLGLAALMCGVAAWEWANINGASMPHVHGLVVGGALVLIESVYSLRLVKENLIFLSVVWVLFLPWVLIKFKDVRRWVGLAEVALLLLGVAFLLLKDISFQYLLSVMMLVWVADTFAYVFGKLFGRHKLIPKVSPGKTWEGLFGAIFSTLVYSYVAAVWWPGSMFSELKQVGVWGYGLILVVVLMLTALSVMGDLFESLLKRQAGIKDSSQLLPGHGGVFDRIDALIPVLPIAAVIHQLIRML
jgi:phosphatidate cytidylyltransferase